MVQSAFGFQGQKCSAASRLIVTEENYAAFLEKLVVATQALQVGPAEANYPVAAVISAEQHGKVLAEIERGKAQAKLLVGGKAGDKDGGYSIEPTNPRFLPRCRRIPASASTRFLDRCWPLSAPGTSMTRCVYLMEMQTVAEKL